MMLTGHITQNQAVVVGEQVYQSLTPPQQTMLVQAARDAGDEQNGLLAQSEQTDLALLRTNGMEVIEPDTDAFRKATANIYRQCEKDWGVGFFERLKAA
jgi:TRAP-type C4-dicarboxylate transport system substrate-binding protein